MRRLTWFVDRCANGANTRYAFGTKLAAQEFAAQQGKLLMRTQGHADGHTAASLSDCRDEVAPEPTATTTGPQIGSECPGCPLPGDRPECCHDRPEESA